MNRRFLNISLSLILLLGISISAPVYIFATDGGVFQFFDDQDQNASNPGVSVDELMTKISAADMNARRASIGTIRQACGLAAFDFTRNTNIEGDPLSATDVMQIRAAIKNVYDAAPARPMSLGASNAVNFTDVTLTEGSIVRETHFDELQEAITEATCCGDGTCQTDYENYSTCSTDCSVCDSNGTCDAWEDYFNCSADCPSNPCSWSEWTSCTGTCPTGTQTRTCDGDAQCTAGTDCSGNASQSCSLAPCCGDGTCDDGEDMNNCYDDCGSCGDGTCSAGEECIADCCGDGTCDAAFEDLDTCYADCGSCGNAAVEGPEECDDGASNGDTADCTSSCLDAVCGDGYVWDDTQTEVCDDGENNGNYDYCNSTCDGYSPYCGDGTVDSDDGEVCDDGIDNGSYGYCKGDCSGMGDECGDGTCQIEEACHTCEDDCGVCKADWAGNHYDWGTGRYCGGNCTVAETGHISYLANTITDKWMQYKCDGVEWRLDSDNIGNTYISATDPVEENHASCLNSGSGCAATTNSSGNTLCTVNANIAHLDSASGTCAENGSCTASCNDGDLTWTNNCTPGTASCSLDGVTVAHGDNYTFYTSSSVDCGSICMGASRTCNNNDLSGDSSYNKASCSENCASCNLGGGGTTHTTGNGTCLASGASGNTTLPHGRTAIDWADSTPGATYGTTCTVGSGKCEAYCYDGEISWNNPCAVAAVQNNDCGSATSGTGGAVCSVGNISHDDSESGTCNQKGTCSASCDNGNLTWTNNCSAYSNCAGATDGSVGSRCTVSGMLHGTSIGGSCDQNGSCSASCDDGDLTWTNNCGTYSACPATTKSDCQLPYTDHGNTVNGTCAENGTCQYYCGDGVWQETQDGGSNFCESFGGCSASAGFPVTNGSGNAQCSITTNAGHNVRVNGSCSQGGNCSALCNDGDYGSWDNSCSAYSSCPATGISSCSLSVTSHGNSSGSCAQAGSCNYVCDNGDWQLSSNSCANYASCPATTLSGCSVIQTSHGSSSGACQEAGTCSYTCNNSNWVLSSNDCNPYAGCPAMTISQCVLGARSHNGTSGGCQVSGTCLYKCNDGNWELQVGNCSSGGGGGGDMGDDPV